MKYLADTNIFLEILLGQQNSALCKEFLSDVKNEVFISDFSLHTIGVILFRESNYESYNKFLSDIKSNIGVLSLPIKKYSSVIQAAEKYKLDFDDAYQTAIASAFNLRIKTQDRDFKRIKSEITVEFF
jgi:predicted nucleic acid-binding protein